jgi:hypothetical protein
MTDDFDSCSPMPGCFTDIDTGIVYCCRDGCGSIPRDIFEDSPGYKVRSALYPELMPAVGTLLDQITDDRAVLMTFEVDCRRRAQRDKDPAVGFECLDLGSNERDLSFHLKRLFAGQRRRERAMENLMNALWLRRGLTDGWPWSAYRDL